MRVIITSVWVALLACAAAGAAPPQAEPEEAARLNAEVVRLLGAGKYEEALPLARRLVELRERAPGGEHPLVARALYNLAAVYAGQGRLQEAEPLFKRALSVLEKGEPASDLAANINARLGIYRLNRKEYKEAIPYLKRALEIREATTGADSPALVHSFLNLTDAYFLRRDFDEALKLLGRALKVLAAQPPRKDQAVAERLSNYLCVTATLKGGEELLQEAQRVIHRLTYPEESAELEKQEQGRKGRGEGGEETAEGGVLNGRAISKPAPSYPDAAKQQGIMGTVMLRITVDEQGRVIKAERICGPLVLAKAATEAALWARFTPTLLSGVPVKVTGIITYNFVLR